MDCSTVEHCGSGGSLSLRPQETQASPHYHHPVPLSTLGAMAKTGNHSTLVSTLCSEANKHQAEQAVKELYHTDEAKANSLLRPDGEKKGYVHLPSEYDHLEVANQIGLL